VDARRNPRLVDQRLEPRRLVERNGGHLYLPVDPGVSCRRRSASAAGRLDTPCAAEDGKIGSTRPETPRSRV
jgi:hypothetical protein